jgi:hypothetical protein
VVSYLLYYAAIARSHPSQDCPDLQCVIFPNTINIYLLCIE